MFADFVSASTYGNIRAQWLEMPDHAAAYDAAMADPRVSRFVSEHLSASEPDGLALLTFVRYCALFGVDTLFDTLDAGVPLEDIFA